MPRPKLTDAVRPPAPETNGHAEPTVIEESYQLVPMGRLLPSGVNPRKHFDEQALAELAASIRAKGVLQPILVRPRPGPPPVSGPIWEIAAGERRFRAAKLAGLAAIPAVVRELSDRDVLEIAVVENDQRSDVTPLERAEGYAALVERHGVTIEDLAKRVGKSESTIRSLLKLRQLPPLAREAVECGHLPAATAELIARVPGAVERERLAREVLWGEEYAPEDLEDAEVLKIVEDGSRPPLSYRQTRDTIRADYVVELGKAPFSRKSLDLVPSAGSCDACPRRVGNLATADLFAAEDYAGVRADCCTDPGCYRSKVEAHGKRLIEEAEQKGRTVLPEAESHKLFAPHQPTRLQYQSAYIDLADTCHETEKPRGYKKLVGKQLAGETVVAVDPAGNVHELVPKASVVKVLKEEHGIKPSGQNGRGSGQSGYDKEAAKRRAAAKAGKAAAFRANARVAHLAAECLAIADGCLGGIAPMRLRTLVQGVVSVVWSDACRRVANRRQLEGADHRQAVLALANQLDDPGALLGLAAELVAAKLSLDWSSEYYGGERDSEKPFWQGWEIDRRKLVKEAERLEKERKAAKGKPSGQNGRAKGKAAAAAEPDEDPEEEDEEIDPNVEGPPIDDPMPPLANPPHIAVDLLDGAPFALETLPNGKVRGTTTLDAFGNWSNTAGPYWPSVLMVSWTASAAARKALLLKDWGEDAAGRYLLTFERVAEGNDKATWDKEAGRKGDRTAGIEANRLWHRHRLIPESPADRELRPRLHDWRRRQATGDTEPRWGRWSEFTVLLPDGRTVEVLYDAKAWPSLEFWGEAVSETGYLHHTFTLDSAPKHEPLADVALRVAGELAEERRKVIEKEARKRKPKSNTKDNGALSASAPTLPPVRVPAGEVPGAEAAAVIQQEADRTEDPVVRKRLRRMVADLSGQPPSGRCRVCGCTEQDCRRCWERTGEPCSWVSPAKDLCSACLAIAAKPLIGIPGIRKESMRVLRQQGLTTVGSIYGRAELPLGVPWAEDVVLAVNVWVKEQLAHTPDGEPIVSEADMPPEDGRPSCAACSRTDGVVSPTAAIFFDGIVVPDHHLLPTDDCPGPLVALLHVDGGVVIPRGSYLCVGCLRAAEKRREARREEAKGNRPGKAKAAAGRAT